MRLCAYCHKPIKDLHCLRKYHQECSLAAEYKRNTRLRRSRGIPEDKPMGYPKYLLSYLRETDAVASRPHECRYLVLGEEPR